MSDKRAASDVITTAIHGKQKNAEHQSRQERKIDPPPTLVATKPSSLRNRLTSFLSSSPKPLGPEKTADSSAGVKPSPSDSLKGQASRGPPTRAQLIRGEWTI